jgi:hypothetical protein
MAGLSKIPCNCSSDKENSKYIKDDNRVEIKFVEDDLGIDQYTGFGN